MGAEPRNFRMLHGLDAPKACWASRCSCGASPTGCPNSCGWTETVVHLQVCIAQWSKIGHWSASIPFPCLKWFMPCGRFAVGASMGQQDFLGLLAQGTSIAMVSNLIAIASNLRAKGLPCTNKCIQLPNSSSLQNDPHASSAQGHLETTIVGQRPGHTDHIRVTTVRWHGLVPMGVANMSKHMT